MKVRSAQDLGEGKQTRSAIRTFFIVALVVMLLSAACDDDGGRPDGAQDPPQSSTGEDFPQSVIANYVEACTSAPESSDSYCRCTLEQIQSELTFEEFEAFDEKMSKGGRLPRRMEQLFRPCLDEL